MPENTEIRKAPQPEIPTWVEVEQRTWPLSESAENHWRINVLTAASHPGGIKALAPLVDKLVRHGSRCTLITSRPIIAEGRAEGATGIAEKSAAKTVLIVGIEDDTPGLKPILAKLHQRGVSLPDQISALCMASRLSKAEYQDSNQFSDIPENKFITTGSPGFDDIHSEDTPEVNTEIRQQLGISPTDIVIAHFAARSSDRYGAVEINATQVISRATTNLAEKYPSKNFVFIHRLHPGEKDPRKLYEIIQSFSDLPNNLRIIPHHQSNRFDTRLISATAHLNTATLSITLTGVALRGARRLPYTYTGQTPLYFLSEGARGILTEVGYDIPPAAKLGAAATADNEKELIPIIEASLFDEKFRRKLFYHQAHEFRDAYRFKGTATAADRVLLQIRACLRKTT